ncbi:MAG: 16S rRNA (uracil(1498)-N(3))-methyltransferase [Roseovarius sp.]|nr:16S rRNA (uracil(1498)-N(3))-methyltransferase [Roseovarius sp.]MCY4208902.1 16S rRNA (uracil(1498)-N(3))-methyltransferase [Roseovarius sp.]MCY4292039.1 16S rRNA (uracil(1498)-N(3))-methyltransferase [Roseovarius sp.]MCY4314998.1 16S rRNA (uracil(1498)-N(3))-methyltransferase [Roseovarius sp.]
MQDGKTRLYVEQMLKEGQCVKLPDDKSHYIFNVMRLREDDSMLLFNGHDGEWSATIGKARRKEVILRVDCKNRPQFDPPDLWLLFAPIKKSRTDFIVEKAAEMGCARILPIMTEFTNSERIRRDRLQTHAIDAIQQCGGTYVPRVFHMQKLGNLLKNWPKDRQIMFCDEAMAGKVAGKVNCRGGGENKWAVLIGPEGGFSDRERKNLHSLPFAHPVSLGPRVLRADTAAVAALAIWQKTLGDWRE